AEFTQVYRNKYAGKILETKNSAIKVAKTSQLIKDVMQKNNKVEQPDDTKDIKDERVIREVEKKKKNNKKDQSNED
ncbi:MAG: hypothetical protein ACLFQU_13160, partial [Candidatus Kapaibacterium sp.]